MRKAVAGVISGGALLLASPAMAAPNERACMAAQPHGALRAHATVPHETAGHHQAHASIPYHCRANGHH